jgi:hypothetical protein
MNYASVVFVGLGAIAMAWYFAWGRKNYEGPPVRDEDIQEPRRTSVISDAK